jgi:putative sigma-54 modulation protein
MSVSDPVKQYCEDKAGKLVRYYDRVDHIEVVLDGKNGLHSAELIVHHGGGKEPLVAKEEHTDLFAAVDLLVDKMERQLTKLKERLRNRKHPPKTGGAPEIAEPEE